MGKDVTLTLDLDSGDYYESLLGEYTVKEYTGESLILISATGKEITWDCQILDLPEGYFLPGGKLKIIRKTDA